MSEPTIDFPSRPATEQASPNLPGIQSAYLGPANSASASATGGGGGGGGVITTSFPGSPTDGERFTLTDSTSAPTWYQDFVWNGTISAWLGVGTARGTSFPGGPKEGMQAILTDSLASPTWNWLFWYSTTATAWLFIGGPPIVVAAASTTLPAHNGDYVLTAKCNPDNGGTTTGANITMNLQVNSVTKDSVVNNAVPANSGSSFSYGGARGIAGVGSMTAYVTGTTGGQSVAITGAGTPTNPVITILPVKLTS